ncbi:MAG: hypothetical protein JNL38_15900 [Myxococcales bacterium]|jgi:hypothetical protein|nr:hypothetical protein [Myxococcales bacterium]
MSSRILVASFAAASLALFARTSSAQDAAPTPPPQAAPAPAPAPAPSVQTAPSACLLGAHPGIEEVDARSAADVICHEIAAKGGAAGTYEIRLNKLGGRIIASLAVTSGQYDERRVTLSSIEEISVAAPRLVDALLGKKAIEDTESVKNVLSTDTPAPKVKSGQVGFNGGVLGVLPLTTATGAAPGVDLGLLYRADRIAVGASGRLAGGGSTESTFSYAVLSSGARYYFMDSDIAPYAGAGVGLSRFAVNRDTPGDASTDGGGFSGYVEVGVDALRTHRIGFTAGLRMDAPFYALKGGGKDEYVTPTSLMVGMQFH